MYISVCIVCEVRVRIPVTSRMRNRLIVLLVAIVVPAAAAAPSEAGPRVETNVVYGMYSGLALLMDVYHP